jgi:hypothetical protein
MNGETALGLTSVGLGMEFLRIHLQTSGQIEVSPAKF